MYIEMSYGKENILGIERTMHYWCSIKSWGSGVAERPMLIIKLQDDNAMPKGFVTLGGVVSSHMPTMWLSANFNVASQTYTYQKLVDLGFLENMTSSDQDMVVSHYWLVYVKPIKPQHKVEFLVIDVYYSEEYPVNLLSH
jgi:hypothetical protein